MAESIDYECGFADAFCWMGEGLSNWMVSAIVDLSNFALASSEFNPESGLWAASLGQTNTWLGLAVLVTIITTAVSITWGLIAMQPQAIRRGLIGGLLAFPATIVALFVVGQGLVVIDEVSLGLVSELMGSNGLQVRVQELVDTANTTVRIVPAWEAAGYMFTAEEIDTEYFRRFAKMMYWVNDRGDARMVEVKNSSFGLLVVFLAIMLLGLLLVSIAFAFRTFVLMILVAFAPLAFVMLSSGGGSAWVRRWTAAVVAMALAKPLMLGSLVLLFNGFSSIPKIDDPTVMPLLIGVVLVGFMPLAAYSLFSFIGGGEGGDGVGSRGGSAGIATARGVGRKGVAAVGRFRIPGRGGDKAGASGGGSGGAPSQPRTPVTPKAAAGGSARSAQSAGKPASGPSRAAARPTAGSPSGKPAAPPPPAPTRGGSA